MSDAKQYPKIVKWSDEDNCYIGTCPGFMFGGVHGDDEIKVYRELCVVVREIARDRALPARRVRRPTRRRTA